MNDRRVPVSREAFERFRNYHRLVLAFSKEALGTLPLNRLLQHACECAAQGTAVQRAKVLCYRRAEDDLLVIAGTGWKPGVVGHASLPTDMRSPPGRAFRTGKPTFIDDLPTSTDFDYSELLRDHGIVSVVNVPIEVSNGVWGVLEVDSAQKRRFDFDDREFLCGFAEILGRTIEYRRQLDEANQLGLDQRVALQERETLFRELQHRVANQLHLIIGSLQLASQRIVDPDAQRAIQHITERAISIAQRHEQLSLTQVEREISLQAFIQRLIRTFIIPHHIVLESRIEDAPTRIGTAVRLGLIINELITNSLKHAFAESGGMISITLTVNQEAGEATLMMSDNGTGVGERPTTGMGMGLIRTLSNDIGGIPEWAGAEGRGTTFTLTFPLDR